MRILYAAIMLLTCMSAMAAGDDFSRKLAAFESAPGVESANIFMSELNALELTDGQITFVKGTPVDSLRQQVYYWAGEYYYEVQNYERAAVYGEKALPLCRNQAIESDCLNLLSLAYFRMSKYSRAADYAKQCYALDAKTGDPDVMSSSLNTLAGIYLGANQLDVAEQYITRAIEVAGKADNPRRLAVLHGMASEIYHASNKDVQALAHIDKAIEIERGTAGDRLALREVQRASVLNGLKRYGEAESLLKSVIPTLERLGDKHSLATALNKLGTSIRCQGRDRESVPYFRRAASLFSAMGDLAGEMHSRRGLYESLWELNPDSAKIELNRFDLLKDSLYSHASAESLARYNAEFGNDRLANENATLTRRVVYVALSLLVLAGVLAAVVWWVMRRRMRVREEALNTIIKTLSEERVAGPDVQEHIDASAVVTDEDFLAQVVGVVRDALSRREAVTVEQLASTLCLSRGHLNRRVKMLTGITTQQYVSRIRMEYARRLLDEDKEMTVAEVGYQCGFDDPSSFTRAFRTTFGVSPTVYRNRD